MEKLEDILNKWNKNWRMQYKKVRLQWLYEIPIEVSDFFENAIIVCAKSPENYQINYGNVLEIRVGEDIYQIREFMVQVYNKTVYFLKDSHNERHISDHFHLENKSAELVSEFLSEFPFKEACEEISQALLSTQLKKTQDSLIGETIVDVINESGDFYLLLSNGEKVLTKN